MNGPPDLEGVQSLKCESWNRTASYSIEKPLNLTACLEKSLNCDKSLKRKYQKRFLSNICFCNMRLRNSISWNFSAILSEKQNTTATIAMEIKYLHVGISN